MDLLSDPPALDLNNRDWVIHTRTEERPPVRISKDTIIENCMIADGCSISSGSRITHSVLSPGVTIQANVTIEDSIILTDCVIGDNSKIYSSILDKHVEVGSNCTIGSVKNSHIAMVGKNSIIPEDFIIEPGGMIGTDVILSDYSGTIIQSGQILQTRRLHHD
jgi:glucose-1-phosphate adenylyltransferase